MTNREQATYDLILANSERGLLTTKKEIVENYPFDREVRVDGYVWNENPKSHDNCSTVWEDINTINFQLDTKIIISYRGVYWVATEKEVKDYVKHYFFTKCRPALKRYWNLLKKLEIDNTVDLYTEAVRRVTLDEED